MTSRIDREQTSVGIRARRSGVRQKKGENLPLLTLRDVVVFPGMVAPLYVGRPHSIASVEVAWAENKRMFLVTQKNAELDKPDQVDVYDIGCRVELLQMLKLPDGNLKVLAQGQSRMKLREVVNLEQYQRAIADPLFTTRSAGPELEALRRLISEEFDHYVKLGRKIPQETHYAIVNVDDVSRLVDNIASHIDAKVSDKQALLSALDLGQRMQILASLLQTENEIIVLEQKLRGEVRSQMEKTQREYYLNEQMKAIQRELGRGGENSEEITELDRKIKVALMPPAAEEKALKELHRLANMPTMSPEATVVRNYLDWLVEVPWSKRSEDSMDIAHAETILNEDHYGLDKPKERILEFLAARQLAGDDTRIPILCFVGPPGVGKTSLGQSIARALNRKFARISLGGVRDEAEIRGHRRTYIGSLPGRIIQSLRRAGNKNPVFLLDEVDKMSVDFRGDPSAALLEVLDPELNSTFSDHYLEVEFDLSEVFFITTANVLHPIPAALRDRMEIIEIPSYTEQEKVQIASQYLVPKQIKANGLTKRRVSFAENSLQTIIQEYTREAGVRNLEREIGSVCRKIAKSIAGGKVKAGSLKVTPAFVRKSLGVPRYVRSRLHRQDEVGVATGLSWTEVGGEVLVVEATIMEGKGNLTLTGHLGEVMQESARAALSYARSRARDLSMAPDFYGKTDIHVHVPEGAIPKDGPSAGITIATATISALTNRTVRKDLAMTGEITLRGRVLPVGGVKEKVLAAFREGIYTILLPEENRKDLEDIPDSIRGTMVFKFVKDMDQVLDLALGKLMVPTFITDTAAPKKVPAPREAPSHPATPGLA